MMMDRIHQPTHAAIFENRYDAGAKLASKLTEYKNQSVVILAIPNGGLPIAVPVALALGAELDLVIARKLPIPLMPEGGFGAVADDGLPIYNQEVMNQFNLTDHQVNYQVCKVRNDIRQRTLLYRGARPPAMLKDKTVIVVDDGLASGYTMIAAIESLRKRQPRNMVVAVPAASATAVKKVERLPVRIITVETSCIPRFFVSDFYRYWNVLSDDDGVRCFKDWQMRRREQVEKSMPGNGWVGM
jgi:putative phosphoribosyl transferase